MKKKKRVITVVYKDNTVDKIPSKYWDDYEYCHGFFVVKRRGTWVVMLNMDSITSITIK